MQRIRQVPWDSLQLEYLKPAIQSVPTIQSSPAEMPAMQSEKNICRFYQPTHAVVSCHQQVTSISKPELVPYQSGTRFFSGPGHRLGGKGPYAAPSTQSCPTPQISQSCSPCQNHDCVSSGESHEDHQLAPECNLPVRGRWRRRFGIQEPQHHCDASEEKRRIN